MCDMSGDKDSSDLFCFVLSYHPRDNNFTVIQSGGTT